MPFPKFFQASAAALRPHFPGGKPVSKPHVGGQLANVGSQLISSGLQDVSPNSTIFTKMVQFIADLQAIIHPDSNFSERVMHLIQGLILGAALAIQITIYFEKCGHSEDTLCKVLPLLELSYAAMLTASAGATTYFGIKNVSQKKAVLKPVTPPDPIDTEIAVERELTR